MEPIKFTLDETYLAGAVCSLKAAIKGRNIKTVKCSLTKTRLKLDCGEWGSAIIPAKSEKSVRFQISNQSLTRAAACYRKYKGKRTEARAVLDKEKKYLETPETWISIV